MDERDQIIAELRRKLAEAGVEGSPPPGEEGAIPRLQSELRAMTRSRDGWKSEFEQLQGRPNRIETAAGPDPDMMIDDLIRKLQDLRAMYGNTCVYIGHLSWGSTALWDIELNQSAAFAIARERRKQHVEHGWNPEHDDGHGDGTLLIAGILIACGVADKALADVDPPSIDGPWCDQLAMHVADKYKTDNIKRLTIAGAMIAAEIDRLIRAERTQNKAAVL